MWLICSVQHMASVSQGFPRGNIHHRGRREQQKERKGCIIFLTLLLLFFLSLTSATVLVLTVCLLCKGEPNGGCPPQLLLPNTLHCPRSPRLLFNKIWMTALGTGPEEYISLSHCTAWSHCGCASVAGSGTCTVCIPLLGKYKAGIVLGRIRADRCHFYIQRAEDFKNLFCKRKVWQSQWVWISSLCDGRKSHIALPWVLLFCSSEALHYLQITSHRQRSHPKSKQDYHNNTLFPQWYAELPSKKQCLSKQHHQCLGLLILYLLSWLKSSWKHHPVFSEWSPCCLFFT